MTTPRSSDYFTLFTDGGSRGNPGPAAAGAVITDPDGRTVFAGGYYLGRATNNVAEYQALILGLRKTVELGVQYLTVRSDSELMVRQLSGRYKVKNAGLKPLYAEAIDLIGRFDDVQIEHVYRQNNVEADRMVNEALDARADVGGATAGEAPIGADWPPERFTATCTADGFDDCPAVISAGGVWVFDGATPGGLCVHAAAGILAAVNAAKPGASAIKVQCAKAGCKASFDVQLEK